MNRKNIPKPVTRTTGLSYREIPKIRAVNALQFFPYSIMTKYHPAGVFRRFFYTSSSMLYTHS